MTTKFIIKWPARFGFGVRYLSLAWAECDWVGNKKHATKFDHVERNSDELKHAVETLFRFNVEVEDLL